jgi:hypothetical protein
VKPAAIPLSAAPSRGGRDWIRTDMAPLARNFGSTISELDNFDSFECRGRNRVAGALLSEHGRANALDVRAFKLANGRSISLTDRTVPRELRENVLHSACARFATVLGPGSDWYHEDHIHLDLMERRNNYRICQWNVYDPLPQVAPLRPPSGPDEAPARAVAAAKSDGARPEAAKARNQQVRNQQVRCGKARRQNPMRKNLRPSPSRLRCRQQKRRQNPALLISCRGEGRLLHSWRCRHLAEPSWN